MPLRILSLGFLEALDREKFLVPVSTHAMLLSVTGLEVRILSMNCRTEATLYWLMSAMAKSLGNRGED